MVRLIGSLAVLASLALVGASAAQDEKKDEAKKKGAGKLGQFDVSKLLEKLDTDGDKKVSKKEFDAFVDKIKDKAGDKGQIILPLLEQVFSKLDADNDGYLTQDELKKASELGQGLLKGFKGKKKKSDS